MGKLEEEAAHEAKRKREHDSKRLAWLGRFAPQGQSQTLPVDVGSTGCAKKRKMDDDVQSQISTEGDEQELHAKKDDVIRSVDNSIIISWSVAEFAHLG